MQEPVTEVLVARAGAGAAAGVSRPVAASLVAHGVLIGALVVIPLLVSGAKTPPLTIMMVSLGATPGPRVPGITAAGGQTIEEVAPLPKRPEITKTVSTNPTAMPEPEKPAKPKPVVKPADTPKPSAQDLLRSYYAAEDTSRTLRKPITGAQVTPGSAIADTGARGVGSGLASGGAGARPAVDIVDFCCMEYVNRVGAAIDTHWIRDQQIKGLVTVRFTLLPDGTITEIEFDTKSGSPVLDANATRALQLAKPPGFPPQFKGPRLTIHLTFDNR